MTTMYADPSECPHCHRPLYPFGDAGPCRQCRDHEQARILREWAEDHS